MIRKIIKGRKKKKYVK